MVRQSVDLSAVYRYNMFVVNVLFILVGIRRVRSDRVSVRQSVDLSAVYRYMYNTFVVNVLFILPGIRRVRSDRVWIYLLSTDTVCL